MCVCVCVSVCVCVCVHLYYMCVYAMCVRQKQRNIRESMEKTGWCYEASSRVLASERRNLRTKLRALL
jgi:hypothetical protein